MLTGKIDYAIRIEHHNKWKVGNTVKTIDLVFKNKDIIEGIILSSEKVNVQCIPTNILRRCGYRSRKEFKEHWENWLRSPLGKITAEEAYLIHFRPVKDVRICECGAMLEKGAIHFHLVSAFSAEPPSASNTSFSYTS